MDLKAPHILFENITVNIVEDNAGIFIGKNRQYRWTTTINNCKSGFGTVSGNNNAIAYNKHLVLCDDFADSAVEDAKEKLKGKNLV